MSATLDESNPLHVTMKIKCDGCGAPAPSYSDILTGGGLNNMGWRCSGGTHFCPKCNAPDASEGNPNGH